MWTAPEPSECDWLQPKIVDGIHIDNFCNSVFFSPWIQMSILL